MPVKQIPVLGPRGVHFRGDATGVAGDMPAFVNGYFEKIEASDALTRKFAYTARPGFAERLTDNCGSNGYNIQGMIANATKTSLFIYANNGVANRVWTVTSGGTTDLGAAPAAAGNWTYTGPVVWTALDGISYGASVHFAVTDFTKGAVVDSANAWTEITDADFTGLTKCTNFVGLDGYLFIGTTNNRIYNSNLNASTTWVSTSFLTAADYPGSLVWLAKINKFLVAFKTNSIEFFEDVGNPTPGSPLEPRKQFNRKIGCINRSTIQEVSDGIIFAGVSGSGGPKLYKIDKQSMEIKPISDRFVEQCLAQSGYTSATAYSIDSFLSASRAGQSQVFNYNGKEFYTINLATPDNGSSAYTQVYDNDLGLWTSWYSATGTSNTPDTYGFVGCQAQMLNIGLIGVYPIFVDNTTSSGSTTPRVVFFSNLNYFDLDTDNSTANSYSIAWTSDNFDFGNRKRKFMDSAEVLYTILSSATPANTTQTGYNLSLKYRDTDYTDTAGRVVTRTMYLDAGGGVRARALRLGSFRRRNFAVIYDNTQKTNFQLWGLEVEINGGEIDQES